MIYDIQDLPVSAKMCPTCPFARSHEQAVELQSQVIARMLRDGASQICHGTEGPERQPNTLCRGARDQMLTLFHRMQFIDSPTDEAWDAKRLEYGV